MNSNAPCGRPWSVACHGWTGSQVTGPRSRRSAGTGNVDNWNEDVSRLALWKHPRRQAGREPAQASDYRGRSFVLQPRHDSHRLRFRLESGAGIFALRLLASRASRPSDGSKGMGHRALSGPATRRVPVHGRPVPAQPTVSGKSGYCRGLSIVLTSCLWRNRCLLSSYLIKFDDPCQRSSDDAARFPITAGPSAAFPWTARRAGARPGTHAANAVHPGW